MAKKSLTDTWASRRGRTISRRALLRGGTALMLGGWGCRAAASGPRRPVPGFGRARSVILLFTSGGQSQLDMWDPKPSAPLDVRGAFAPIATALPGVQFGEHLPRLARLADRCTLVRCMSHEDLDHGTAAYLALTGRYHVLRSANPPPRPTDFPTYGAIVNRVRPTRQFVSNAVTVNGPALVPTQPAPGQDGGYLGAAFAPLLIGDVAREQAAVSGLELYEDLPVARLDLRRGLKEQLDACARQLADSPAARTLDHRYQQALEVLGDPRCRGAFQLEAEPAAVRERYGRHRAGQACLLARRLVEAGVPWITVMHNHSNRGQDLSPEETEAYGWDTHNDIFVALKQHLLPRFDQTLAALLEDLDERGLLDETLVVCMGEFGRAPRVAFEARFAGQSPGRKHWASVYSILLAGAGVARGRVVGASDRLGAEPLGERYGPWDVAATMFSALGIDPQHEFYDLLERPAPIALGQPIAALY